MLLLAWYVGINGMCTASIVYYIARRSEIGDRESFVSRSRDFLASFTSSRIQFKVPNLMQHTGTWSPAIAPLIKINFDIAVYDAGYYQVGLVACDSTGELVVWSHER